MAISIADVVIHQDDSVNVIPSDLGKITEEANKERETHGDPVAHVKSKHAAPDGTGWIEDAKEIEAALDLVGTEGYEAPKFTFSELIESSRVINREFRKLYSNKELLSPYEQYMKSYVMGYSDLFKGKEEENIDFTKRNWDAHNTLINILHRVGFRIYAVRHGADGYFVHSPNHSVYMEQFKDRTQVYNWLASHVAQEYPRLMVFDRDIVKNIAWGNLTVNVEGASFNPAAKGVIYSKSSGGRDSNMLNTADLQMKPARNSSVKPTASDRRLGKLLLAGLERQLEVVAEQNVTSKGSYEDILAGLKHLTSMWANGDSRLHKIMPLLIGDMGSGKSVTADFWVQLKGIGMKLTAAKLASNFSFNQEFTEAVHVEEFDLTLKGMVDLMKTFIDSSYIALEHKNVGGDAEIINTINYVGTLNSVSTIVRGFGNGRRYPTYLFNGVKDSPFSDNPTVSQWVSESDKDFLEGLRYETSVKNLDGEETGEVIQGDAFIQPNVERVANSEGLYPFAWGQLAEITGNAQAHMGAFKVMVKTISTWNNDNVKLNHPNSRPTTAGDVMVKRGGVSSIGLTSEMAIMSAKVESVEGAGNGFVGSNYYAIDLLLPKSGIQKKFSEAMQAQLSEGVWVGDAIWSLHMIGESHYLLKLDPELILGSSDDLVGDLTDIIIADQGDNSEEVYENLSGAECIDALVVKVEAFLKDHPTMSIKKDDIGRGGMAWAKFKSAYNKASSVSIMAQPANGCVDFNIRKRK